MVRSALARQQMRKPEGTLCTAMTATVAGVVCCLIVFFFFQAEDGIRDLIVTGVQTCALPISGTLSSRCRGRSSQDRLGEQGRQGEDLPRQREESVPALRQDRETLKPGQAC